MTAKSKRRLRTGFTTGAAAAAAARGALILLLGGQAPSKVRITFLTGASCTIAVHRVQRISDDTAHCSVIKDAGDDPDITHGAEIGARVTYIDQPEDERVEICGGQGVGRVTLPGLEVPPGEPAINPGPRQMITNEVQAVLSRFGRRGRVRVEVFVPRGRELARKTLNARLGIVGGLSILGTTGIVRPLSHQAYVATIESALSVARATGQARVVLTTGRRSERHAQTLWPELDPEAFIQMGDYFETTLQAAARMGLQRLSLAVFFGKALKMAQGIAHTHAAKARIGLEHLAGWARDLGAGEVLAAQMAGANTARQAFGLAAQKLPALIACVGQKMVAAAAGFAGPEVVVDAVIFDFEGQVAWQSESGPEGGAP